MSKEIKLTDRNLLDKYKNSVFDKSKIIDEELLDVICKISAKNKVEVAIVTNRKGQVIDIVSGDSTTTSVNINYDSNSNRLSGYRILHTHPYSSSNLSEQDISILKKCKLDYLCAISVDDTGAKKVSFGIIENNQIKQYTYDNAYYINKYGIQDKIQEIIEKDKKENTNLINTDRKIDKAILVAVDINKSQLNMYESLEEFTGSCKTNDIEVVDVLTQNKVTPDPKYLLGKGKV